MNMRGAAAGAALAVALILGWWALAPHGSVEPDVPASALVPPADPEPSARAVPLTAPRELSARPDPETDLPAAPELDVVRIAPNGDGLIAGRAFAPAPITLMLEGAEIATVEPDARGDFVLFFDLPPKREPQIASLHQPGTQAPVPSLVISTQQSPTPDVEAAPEPAAATGSAEAPRAPDAAVPNPSQRLGRTPQVGSATAPQITANGEAVPAPTAQRRPPGAPESGSTPQLAARADAEQERPGIAAPDAARPAAKRPEGVVAQTGARPDPTPAELSPREPTPQVVVADAEGVRVTQGAANQVSIAAIGYDKEGGVRFSGWGGGGDRVQLYLDNAPIAQTEVEQAGGWNIDGSGIAAGTYVLRADALDGTGAVISRAETPFLREPSAAVADLVTKPEAVETGAPTLAEVTVPDTGIRTVQPGNTLWALAETRYGDGLAYVHIFEANSDQIRDPDLIYPGQIFHLPDVAIESGRGGG